MSQAVANRMLAKTGGCVVYRFVQLYGLGEGHHLDSDQRAWDALARAVHERLQPGGAR